MSDHIKSVPRFELTDEELMQASGGASYGDFRIVDDLTYTCDNYVPHSYKLSKSGIKNCGSCFAACWFNNKLICIKNKD